MAFSIAYKLNVTSIIQKFDPFVKNQLFQKLKFFRSDGGGKFCNTSLKPIFDSKGISHKKSCPYTPKQNGITERKQRKWFKLFVSIFSFVCFHRILALCFLYCIIFIDQMLFSSLKIFSPFEMFFCYTFDLYHLKVFGYACYPLLKHYIKHKNPKTSMWYFDPWNKISKGFDISIDFLWLWLDWWYFWSTFHLWIHCLPWF